MLFLKQNFKMFSSYDKVAEFLSDEEDYRGDMLSYFNFTASYQQQLIK